MQQPVKGRCEEGEKESKGLPGCMVSCSLRVPRSFFREVAIASHVGGVVCNSGKAGWWEPGSLRRGQAFREALCQGQRPRRRAAPHIGCAVCLRSGCGLAVCCHCRDIPCKSSVICPAVLVQKKKEIHQLCLLCWILPVSHSVSHSLSQPVSQSVSQSQSSASRGGEDGLCACCVRAREKSRAGI